VVVEHVFCVVCVRACVLPLAALFSKRDSGSVVIRGYVPQGAGFYMRNDVYVIQRQLALVIYISLGQLDSSLCFLSDVSTPFDAAGRSR